LLRALTLHGHDHQAVETTSWSYLATRVVILIGRALHIRQGCGAAQGEGGSRSHRGGNGKLVSNAARFRKVMNLKVISACLLIFLNLFEQIRQKSNDTRISLGFHEIRV
jgi:hypothetical protein